MKITKNISTFRLHLAGLPICKWLDFDIRVFSKYVEAVFLIDNMGTLEKCLCRKAKGLFPPKNGFP